jgi:hypothetical protein
MSPRIKPRPDTQRAVRDILADAADEKRAGDRDEAQPDEELPRNFPARSPILGEWRPQTETVGAGEG